MRQGAIAILPLAVGVVIYGFAFGLLASQIVAVEQFSGSSAVLGAALAGAALNLRYIGIIASLSELLNGLPLRMKLLAIHITGDENWALTMSERAKSKDVGASFLIGSGLVLISVWTASTAGGALVGAALPNLEQFGLGFAFTAAFIAMARGLWRGYPNFIPWSFAFGATSAIIWLGLPKAYAIVAGAFCGLTASKFIRHSRGHEQ